MSNEAGDDHTTGLPSLCLLSQGWMSESAVGFFWWVLAHLIAL